MLTLLRESGALSETMTKSYLLHSQHEFSSKCPYYKPNTSEIQTTSK